jgi:hypothetical protein
MKAFTKSIFAALLLVFISCNPDEDLDNNGNSGNNGNNGNNGGGNTINPVSYPEIVNLLEGNWYGDSIVLSSPDGTPGMAVDLSGTHSVGYLTFSSNIIGNADFTPPAEGILAPPYENLVVSKYPASVTITDGSWSGTGIEQLTSSTGFYVYAWEWNSWPDKSYCVVDCTTPCYNITTSTIQYGIICGADITLFPSFTLETGNLLRIHTLNSTTLKLIVPGGNTGYLICSFTKQQ